MRRIVVLALCIGWAACGTARPGAPIARPRAAPSARVLQAPAPATAPEQDPANVERRFGVNEARERKEQARQQRQQRTERVEPLPEAPRRP